ncbi:acyl-CoA dehydrogenase C-terminal domain-containing protein [Phenylobacterium immobile]|uniref:acyl-CoA dehydrogenase C-terminal domain-containing protein n=1 Tax=Phenylobacterium immobile TaxID=21 RepID=UPI000B03837A|nr:acyl-CoA dehydrogenase C-terminal domain-containing protein [Phenylobacterium immobile]
MAYQAPVKDYAFLFRDVLKIERYANLPAFAEAQIDTVDQILEEAGRFCDEVLAPLNTVGDKEGCRLNAAGDVTTPTGFKAAYRQLIDAGWPLLSAEAEFGGQALPKVINLAFSEMSSGANMAFAMYPGLTHGAYSAILNGGSPEQKQLYLPKLAAGQWTGTMNLTEPHAGTDLGLLRTKAVKQGDGSYKITGQKIFISAGEHDLAENIIHLVLARAEGAPEGVRGISLFIVPKFIPDAAGDPGARNGVSCVALEEKMGIHGNATCVLAHDEATGWLVGEENRGLALMFVMMNEARIGVAVQGLAQGEAAYQAAAAYARDRLQGRSVSGPKNPDGPADPIIVHPDVRRLLLDARATMEGGRAFLMWTGLQADVGRASDDPAARERGEDFMALLTPVLKGYLTDRGFQACSDALQVHGGAGYTEAFPASQYLRDARIAMIYEGTNGVQALDLVGRKLAQNGGRALRAFLAELEAYSAAHQDSESLKPFVEGLDKVRARLQEATMWLMQNGLANPDEAAAASTDYMHLMGLTGLAYAWAMMAQAAQARIDAGDDDPFYATKLDVGRYFLARVLPESGAHLAKLKAGAATLMALKPEAF